MGPVAGDAEGALDSAAAVAAVAAAAALELGWAEGAPMLPEQPANTTPRSPAPSQARVRAPRPRSGYVCLEPIVSTSQRFDSGKHTYATIRGPAVSSRFSAVATAAGRVVA